MILTAIPNLKILNYENIDESHHVLNMILYKDHSIDTFTQCPSAVYYYREF